MKKGMFDLSGKVALITGGASGIGYGLADGIAEAGGTVVIWGRTEAKNLAAVEKLARHGSVVRSRRVDVAEEQQVIDGMAAAVEEFGRVDAVFANAGIGGGARFVDFPTDVFRNVLSVNLEGVFWTLREGARHMVARARDGDPGGSLVATSSLTATHGAPGNQAYASSKGAVVSMIKGVSMELARFGVRANAILPGWVDTEMTAPMVAAPVFRERVIPRVPMRRWGQPDDYKGIGVYLVSDLSAYHTGDSIIIDGGWAIS